MGLVTPYLIGIDHQSSQSAQWPVTEPLRTVTLENRFAVVAPFLSKYHGQKTNETRGQRADAPLRTQDTSNRFGLVSAFLTKFYGTNIGSDMRQPVPTVTATGQHIGQVQAFLIKYYGCGVGQDCREPMHTITSKDRLGLVTVAGERYQIADIGLRMLAPRELALAQGFPADYLLTGTKSCQVAKIGNSVCPPVAEALVRANVRLADAAGKAVG
jgi:DNA (cytosine-5)-methyltransferase 1